MVLFVIKKVVITIDPNAPKTERYDIAPGNPLIEVLPFNSFPGVQPVVNVERRGVECGNASTIFCHGVPKGDGSITVHNGSISEP